MKTVFIIIMLALLIYIILMVEIEWGEEGYFNLLKWIMEEVGR
jgi:hypothetical protein